MHPQWDDAYWNVQSTLREEPKIRCPALSVVRLWPAGSQPLYLAAIARGLTLAQIGERWSVVREALQFANVLQEDPRLPVSTPYEIASSYASFGQMASAPGNSPISPFVPCALICDSLRLPRRAYRDFSRPEGCSQPLSSTVRRFRDPPTERPRTLYGLTVVCWGSMYGSSRRLG